MDFVEIARFEGALERFGERFAERILSPGELVEFRNSSSQARMLAKRFAAKEAVAKALGTGMGDNASPSEIEVKNDDNGKPFIVLSGSALRTFNASGAEKIDVSLSHGRDYAVAFAVITYKEGADE